MQTRQPPLEVAIMPQDVVSYMSCGHFWRGFCNLLCSAIRGVVTAVGSSYIVRMSCFFQGGEEWARSSLAVFFRGADEHRSRAAGEIQVQALCRFSLSAPIFFQWLSQRSSLCCKRSLQVVICVKVAICLLRTTSCAEALFLAHY